VPTTILSRQIVYIKQDKPMHGSRYYGCPRTRHEEQVRQQKKQKEQERKKEQACQEKKKKGGDEKKG